MVLSSRKPRKGFTVVPYAEETGGKIFRSNGKHPGDVRIALIADPLDSEVGNLNEGTLDVAIQPCSYVFVDSNQITGGRIRTAISPRSPGRRNASERFPSQARSVSAIQSVPGRSRNVQTTATILAEIRSRFVNNKGLTGW